MTAPDALDAALERLSSPRARGIGLVLARRSQPGEGWIEGTTVSDDGDVLDDLLAGVARQAGTDRDSVCAAWLLEKYAWQLCSLTAAFVVAERRLPDVARSNVLMGVYEGLAWGIALRGGDLREEAGDAVLAEQARDALVEHLEPLIGALAGRGLRRARPLWHAAGDRVAQAFLWSGLAFDQRQRAEALARSVLEAGSPLSVPVRSALDPSGQPFHLRVTCCLKHQTPAAGLCHDCPAHRHAPTPRRAGPPNRT